MRNETTKDFQERLEDLINESEKKINQLAKEIGVPSGSLSKYQNDNAEAGITRLVKIAKYFNVSTDYLLGLTHVRTPDVDIKAISNNTGLSEKAIEKLYKSKSLQYSINKLLEYDYIHENDNYESGFLELLAFYIKVPTDYLNAFTEKEVEEFTVPEHTEAAIPYGEYNSQDEDYLLFMINKEFDGIIKKIKDSDETLRYFRERVFNADKEWELSFEEGCKRLADEENQ